MFKIMTDQTQNIKAYNMYQIVVRKSEFEEIWSQSDVKCRPQIPWW